MEAERPNPEALLASIEERRSGKLKIYLGMSAGVGKTYAMLSDALQDRDKGVDVVAGYVEPHDRKDTLALALRLEELAQLKINYRGVDMHELDIDAALKRRPKILLVDELAHTNAPGSRHEKRWQDVDEVLRAGIDVYSTMNVQHIESLNDVVTSITGIQVKETVPDTFFARADSIELVDIPPEELIQRLKDGKIYDASKVDNALKHFFQKKNLIALRELVLRQAAERVDDQMRKHRNALGVTSIWPTTERILVCVAPNAFSSRVVRAAGRMARSLHADLIALSVESLRYAALPASVRETAAAALRLAEDLGGETIVRTGDDITQEILSLAREKNVTSIVIGKPLRPRWREFIFGSVVDEIIRKSGDIGVHVIPGGAAPEGVSVPIRTPHAINLHGFSLTLFVTVLCSLLSRLMYPYFDLSNLIMIYLLGVTWVAVRLGRLEAVLASVLSVLAFDFFFVPPRFTFAVHDVQYVVTFLVMLLVGFCISGLTLRVRAQTQVVGDRERRTSALYGLVRKLSVAQTLEAIARGGVNCISEILHVEAALFVRQPNGDLTNKAPSATHFEEEPNEAAVVHWVNDHELPAGSGTGTLPGAKGRYLPLVSGGSRVGVLAVQLNGHPIERNEEDLLDAMCVQLALAIERVNIQAGSQRSQIEFEKERLRSMLLSSVSHDLRTPLASIAGAASSLLSGNALTENNRHELLFTINDQAQRLSRIVRNVLDMTRLESAEVVLRKEWHSIEELVGSAVRRTEELLRPREIEIHIDGALPLVLIDGSLVEQALVNLLENVAKHTLPETKVSITSEKSGAWTIVDVADSGLGISPGEEERIFEKLYRGKDAGGEGTGFGLAICRAIMTAHGGTITAKTGPYGGAIFSLRFPSAELPPEVPSG